MSSFDSLKKRLMKPVWQAVILVLCCLIVQILGLLAFGTGEDHVITRWIISAAFTMFYSFLSAIILLQTESVGTYFTRSFYGYFMILIGSAGLAYVFAGGSVQGAESIRMIYIMITFSFFVFLTIALLMRKIIEYAQRQDTENRH